MSNLILLVNLNVLPVVTLLLADNGEAVRCHCMISYVGPGAGLTTIGALLAVLAMLGLAMLGPLLYPIRMLRRWSRQRKAESAKQQEASTQE